jgi:isoleucyl-tRNA synthetase
VHFPRLAQALQLCVELGRIARDRRGISLKTPVKKVLVVSSNKQLLQDVTRLKEYLLVELNG